MKKNLMLFAAALALILSGCAKEPAVLDNPGMLPEESAAGNSIVPADAVPGIMVVKFKTAPQNEEQIKAMMPSINIKSVSRTFPDDPRYPKRIKASGMDRWYNIVFDEKASPMTKAAASLSANEDLEHIDFVTKAVLNAEPALYFNDPMLPKQWHYINDGSVSGPRRPGVAGADINLGAAWKVQTGSEDVIVAVLDGGIDYSHEDLAEAMWLNEAELHGTPGVDDDNNGYVDDIYGYNFCTKDGSKPIGTIVPEEHGTHVAGTIGAVNNNNIGVCGIAGGDGTRKGVRLMSVQTTQQKLGAYISTAFYYAANNGAVICNCSWGLPSGSSESLNEAIKYFKRYAGMDDDGNQTGPIAGGVVIFSAGNSNSSVVSTYPADLDYVLAVSAFAPDMKAAYYTNFGSWVDIAAPGGDQEYNYQLGGVLSTVPGGYEFLQGTSMACPHVVGVAALVASQFKGQGFTGAMLEDVLLKTANKDIYDYNPSFKQGNLLGVGRVDAGAAVSSTDNPPVDLQEFKAVSVKANRVTVEFLAPAPGADRSAIEYIEMDIISKNSHEMLSLTYDALPGNTFRKTLTLGEFNTGYTLTATPKNSIGAKGNPVTISVTTGRNHAPVIESLDPLPLTLRHDGKADIHILLKDEDDHDCNCNVTGDKAGVTYAIEEREDGAAILVLSFDALKMAPGNHLIYITLTDSYDTTELAVPYTVLPDNPPVPVGTIDNVIIGAKGESTDIDLSKYFNDPDGDALTFTVANKGTASVVDASVTGSKLTITGKAFGYDDLTVTASDIKGMSATQSFRILLRDASQEMDFYPIPVKTALNIRTGADGSGSVTVYNAAGSKVIEQDINFGPFNPAAVDFSSLASGTYAVVVKTSGKNISKTIVKE